MTNSIAVLNQQDIRSWPKYSEGGRVTYRPIRAALTSEYGGDAHLAAYSVPAFPRRLGKDALGRPEIPSVRMGWALFDIDFEGAEESDDDVPPEWWARERDLVRGLFVRRPGGYCYRTRHGYRVIYRTPKGMELRTPEDADRWAQLYEQWLYDLGRGRIYADPACCDWTRLFRIPHGTRDGRTTPERRETIGDPNVPGVWDCGYGLQDFAPKRISISGSSREFTDEGAIYHALKGKGMVGAQLERGKWAIVCPRQATHSKGRPMDGSTVLYAPAPGHTSGWIHCSHRHCKGLRLKDFVNV